jgi:FkbM family methyltransferase
MYKSLFWLLSRLGRPFGGIRPRRMTYWVARKAFGSPVPAEGDLRWYTDRDGSRFLLHPYFVVDREIIAFGAYDAALFAFINRNVTPGMVCLDVGANIGAMTLPLARRVGRAGRVHAFEPVPHLHARLRLHVETNDLTETVRTHRLALSDRAGETTIRIADPSFPNQGQGSLVSTPDDPASVAIPIPCTTLDEFVRKEGLSRIDLIKLDIQGAEPLFLRGATRTLANLRPDLLVEISPTDLAGLGLTSRDLLRAVHEIGYDIHTLTNAGRVGPPVLAEAVPADYSNHAVLCQPRGCRGSGPTNAGRS